MANYDTYRPSTSKPKPKPKPKTSRVVPGHMTKTGKTTKQVAKAVLKASPGYAVAKGVKAIAKGVKAAGLTKKNPGTPKSRRAR